MVISAGAASWSALYWATTMRVAGMAEPIRMTIGMTVQMASSTVLWVKLVSATAPLDLRNLNIA